jgi:hypothetical protein
MYIVGFAMIGLGLYIWLDNRTGLEVYDAQTDGRVIKYVGPITNKLPVVEYYLPSSTLTFIDSTASLSERTKRETAVIYNSENPKVAMMYDPYDVWGVPLSIAIVGFFINLFGFVLFRVGD